MKAIMVRMVVVFATVFMLMTGLPNIAYCSPMSDGDYMRFQTPSPSPSLSTESPVIPHNIHDSPVVETPQPMTSIVWPSGVSPSWIDRCSKYYHGLDDLLRDLGALFSEGLVHIDGYVQPQWCLVFQGPTKNVAQICFCENLRDPLGYRLQVGRELLAACQKKPTKAFC